MSNAPSDSLVLFIDAQKTVCDPNYTIANAYPLKANDYTDKACQKIASCIKAFRKANYPIVWAFIQSSLGGKDDKPSHPDCWHRVQPDEGEGVFGRLNQDAFENIDLLDYVHSKSPKRLIIGGVHLNQCVLDTVKTALEPGLEIVILSDCVADGHLSASLKKTPEESMVEFQKALESQKERDKVSYKTSAEILRL